MRVFEYPIYVTRPLLPSLDSYNEKLKEIWESKWLTNNGLQHQLLEQKLKDRLRVPNLSLFSNGTIALMIACRALGLKGEVITTPFSFAATSHVLDWNNITPVFCDIDDITMNIDSSKIEQYITDNTTAILPVHVFGTPCEVEKIGEIAHKHNVKVIYDAAHAFGVELNGMSIGNYGDLSMFSFHATKAFHTIEGGALAIKNEKLKCTVDLLKNFGIKNEEEVLMSGINGKMNEFQAAMGLLISDVIEKEVEKRKNLVSLYRNLLRNIKGISYLNEIESVKSNYQYFVIRVNDKEFGRSRDYVYDKYKEYNVFARKYFYPLISNYECYKHIPSANVSNLPNANRVASEVLLMPLYGELETRDIENICEILISFRK